MKSYFKKLTAVLMALIMMLAVFAACGDKNEDDNEKNDKKDNIEWYGDINSHWQLDASGAKIEEGEHNVVDKECTVCYADFFDNYDGGLTFMMPDKHGHIKYSATFDADNIMIKEETAEIEHDKDGKILSEKWTDRNGNLTQEVYYNVVDGKSLTDNAAYYYDDGSKLTEKYENGYVIESIYYDSNGQISFTNTFENEYDENGIRISTKEYYDSVLTYESYFEVIEENGYYESELKKLIEYRYDGVRIESNYVNGAPVEEVRFDDTGKEISKTLYTNDDDGNAVFSKKYVDGVIVKETAYALYSDGFGTYEKTITEYESDGSKTVTEYNESYEVVSKIKYDANGKVIN